MLKHMGLHYKSIYIVLSQLGTLSTLGPDKKIKQLKWRWLESLLRKVVTIGFIQVNAHTREDKFPCSWQKKAGIPWQLGTPPQQVHNKYDF